MVEMTMSIMTTTNMMTRMSAMERLVMVTMLFCLT